MSEDRLPTDTVDVLVIGAGGSGLAAAAAAAQAGARVLVLEKQAAIGGTSAMAVGSISAAGTRLQRRAGITDDVQSFHEDMDAFTGDVLARDCRPLRAMLAREAAPTVDWLETLGVAFAGPYPEPPHRVNRMHNTIPGPRAIVERLLHAARRHGARLLCEARVQSLCRDAQGRVTGALYEHGGQLRRALARGGVVMASGDFSGSDAMRLQHLPAAAARALPINPRNVGDGFALTAPLAPGYRNMDAIFGPQMRFARAARAGLNERLPTWPWLTRIAAAFFMAAPPWMLKPLVSGLMVAHMSPSEQLFAQGAVLVDSQGARLDTARPAQAIAATEDRTGYIVMSEQVARAFCALPHFISTAPGIAYAFLADYERARPDLVHRAVDGAGLAQRLAMPPAPLSQALESLGHGPWVALGPVHAMLTTTEGALAADEKCRVLDPQDATIPGLYAVGCLGQGGLLLRGHGLHLAWAFTSGRVAGLHAAQAARDAAAAPST